MDNMRRISDRLFLLFLFLLPFQTVFLLREPVVGGEKWQYGTVGIYLSTVVALSGLLFSALERFRKRKGSVSELLTIVRRGRRADLVLLLLVLWAGVSVSWAADGFLAAYAFLLLLLAADIFVWTRETVRGGRADAVLMTLIAASSIQALLGIWQFTAQESFSSTILGTAVHPVWEAGTSVLKNGSGRWLRAYGTFPHPNMYGLFLAVGLIAAVRLPLFRHGSPVRHVAAWGAVAIIVFGLAVSFSRIAWLGAAMGLSALFLWKFLRDGISKVTVATIAVVAVSLLSATVALRETILPRFDADVVAVEGSVTERMTTYRDAWRVIGESPLLGTGMWNSTAELLRLEPDRPVWDIQPAHDAPLLVLSELGIPGVFLLVLFLVLFRSGFGLRDTHALAGTCLVFVPSLLLDHFLWSSHFGLLFLFVLLGLARGLADAERKGGE